MSTKFENILAYKRKNITFEDFLVILSKSKTPIIDCNWNLFANIAYGTPEPKLMDNSLSNLANFALKLFKNQKGGGNNYNQKGGFPFLQFLMLMFMLFYMATAEVDKPKIDAIRDHQKEVCTKTREIAKQKNWYGENDHDIATEKTCMAAADTEWQSQQNLWEQEQLARLRETKLAQDAQENANDQARNSSAETARLFSMLISQFDATVEAQNSATFYKMFSAGCATGLACMIGFMIMNARNSRTEAELRIALIENQNLRQDNQFLIANGPQLQIAGPGAQNQGNIPVAVPVAQNQGNIPVAQGQGNVSVVGQDINTLVQQIAANQNIAAATTEITRLLNANPETAFNNIRGENLEILLNLPSFVQFINHPNFARLRGALRAHFDNLPSINVLTGGKKQKKTRKRTKKYRR
jgi:hypothetical protein